MNGRMCTSPCPTHPACLPPARPGTGRHPRLQPQSSVGGKQKGSHSSLQGTLLSRAGGGLDTSDFKAFALRVETVIPTYVRSADCVCVPVYTPYAVSEALHHINCLAGWLQAAAIW